MIPGTAPGPGPGRGAAPASDLWPCKSSGFPICVTVARQEPEWPNGASVATPRNKIGVRVAQKWLATISADPPDPKKNGQTVRAWRHRGLQSV